MASYPPYVPAKDADFATWLANFDALLTANPGDFGLDAGDAAIVAPVAAAFDASYPISQDPATRTAATVAQKDNDRANAEAIVRPFAVRISKNPAVIDANKIAIGVNVPSLVPTPVPAPVDAPSLSVISMTPGLGKFGFKTVGALGKSKPFGAIGVEIATAIGATHTANPLDAALVGTVTKSPFLRTFSAADAGQKLSMFARFVTRSGPGGVAQTGPWSGPLQTIVV